MSEMILMSTIYLFIPLPPPTAPFEDQQQNKYILSTFLNFPII